MNQKENNIQIAFILSIIAQGILLLFIIVPGYISIPGGTPTRGLLLLTYYPAPLILGIIALNMCNVTSLEDVGTKFKTYRIVARVLSIIAIVVSAIIVFVNFIQFVFHF